MPYDFTVDDFSKFTQDVLEAKGDQATLTSIMADMQTTVTNAMAAAVKSSENEQRITAENERLRNANMELFLRVGDTAASNAGLPQTSQQQKDESSEITVNDFMSNYFKKVEGN